MPCDVVLTLAQVESGLAIAIERLRAIESQHVVGRVDLAIVAVLLVEKYVVELQLRPLGAATQKRDDIARIGLDTAIGRERGAIETFDHSVRNIEVVPITVALVIAQDSGARRTIPNHKLCRTHAHGVACMAHDIVALHGKVQIIAVVEHAQVFALMSCRGKAHARPAYSAHGEALIGFLKAKRIDACRSECIVGFFPYPQEIVGIIDIVVGFDLSGHGIGHASTGANEHIVIAVVEVKRRGPISIEGLAGILANYSSGVGRRQRGIDAVVAIEKHVVKLQLRTRRAAAQESQHIAKIT